MDGVTAADRGGGRQVVNQAALGLLLVFAVQGVFSALRVYLFTVAGERVVTRLRRDLYAAIVRREIAFFDEQRTGELGSRLAADTALLQNAVSVNVSMALRFSLTAVGGVVILFFTSLRLTLLMLAIVPVVVVLAVGYGRIIRKLSREVQDALARAGEVAEETLAGIRTVRAFAREDAEARRYGDAVETSFQLARRRARSIALFQGGAGFLGYAAVAAVLWYGGVLVLGGQMGVGQLTAFILYTLLIAFSLGALSELWGDFNRATGASERVFQLLDAPSAMPASGARPAPGELRGEVRLVRVDFAYPARPEAKVLGQMDLTLRPGEVVAVVGPSGAGKSTVAALLCRFYDPQAGQVLLDGRDVRELDPVWLREQVGVVSQEPILFATSIAENIRYGRPGASMDEVIAAARAANAHDFISGFAAGYETLVGERGVRLSGGQKQRVAIARALLKDPRILVLDEATSALDVESEALVQQALERLMQGRTTLIIAHRLSTVMGADRVVVLDGGRVVQEGRHQELVAVDGLYRRLVERQFAS
jgi:ATP-binding cassette subfamily B protein